MNIVILTGAGISAESGLGMHMTAIHVQTERKRQDRSARCAEKHRLRGRTRQSRCLICPAPEACTVADAAQDKKRLSSGRIKAIFTSVGMTLGECRLGTLHSKE